MNELLLITNTPILAHKLKGQVFFPSYLYSLEIMVEIV